MPGSVPLPRLARTYDSLTSRVPFVGGSVVGGGVVLDALSALSVEVYAAFLLPEASKSSGFAPVRHESLSRTPHTVMPVQRETARHALDTCAYALAWFEPCSMSSSVIWTSTPRSEKRLKFAWRSLGTVVPRCVWKPTQSIGTPRDLKSRTML